MITIRITKRPAYSTSFPWSVTAYTRLSNGDEASAWFGLGDTLRSAVQAFRDRARKIGERDWEIGGDK